MKDLNSRALKVRLRVAAMRVTHGVTLQKIAEELDYNPAYVSNVLRGQDESKTALDRIEELLDRLEAEDEEMKLAA